MTISNEENHRGSNKVGRDFCNKKNSINSVVCRRSLTVPIKSSRNINKDILSKVAATVAEREKSKSVYQTSGTQISNENHENHETHENSLSSNTKYVYK